jgi:hypothetical protein
MQDWQICTSIAPVTWATVTTEGYPGELGVSGTVTIQSGHSITLDVSPASAIGSLVFANSATATSLTISGFTLNVTGSVTFGNPSVDAGDQTLIVGTGTLNCASITMPDTGADNQDLLLTISTGTVNVSGNFTMNNANRSNTVFTDAGFLYVGGNFTGGGFACGTGTVNYNGAIDQNIGAYTYYNLIVSVSNTKSLTGTTVVNNNLTVDAGTLELNTRAFSVTGTSSISGVLNDNSNTGANSFTGKVTVNPGGQWLTTAETTITDMIFRGGITNNGTFSQAPLNSIPIRKQLTEVGPQVLQTMLELKVILLCQMMCLTYRV